MELGFVVQCSTFRSALPLGSAKNVQRLGVGFLLALLLLMSIRMDAWGQGAAGADMPIIAYIGVPSDRSTEADFRTFSDCGFTVSLNHYHSLNGLLAACRAAEKCGVQVLGYCHEMAETPVATARQLMGEKGFFGYFLRDEPSETELFGQQQLIRQLSVADSTHAFYVNLLPYHGAHYGTEAVRKAPAYQKYLAAASAMGCQQISFDHYPVLKSGLRATWYHNLEMVRNESLASGKPFWGFVLSVPHDDYPQPTMAALRLQVYSNLAYGAQAIQYFTYWTPADNSHHDFHNAPIATNGKKTKTYGLVKRMNEELKPVARLFRGARVTSVCHLGTVAEGASRLTSMPLNIGQMGVSGIKGAVVSQFQKDGHSYLAIVNKNHLASIRLYITTKNDSPRHLTKGLKEERMKNSYAIAAGDIILFKLQ